jgi:hypothetical protein
MSFHILVTCHGFVFSIFNIKIELNSVCDKKIYSTNFFSSKKCHFTEIVADEKLTKNIEAIEDALGNEVYYFYSKANRKSFDRQSSFHDERM